jgi:hypothetical protein
MGEVLYTKTPAGQLLYDLAFTDLGVPYLARKHRLSWEEVRVMRGLKEIVKLRRQTAQMRRKRARR